MDIRQRLGKDTFLKDTLYLVGRDDNWLLWYSLICEILIIRVNLIVYIIVALVVQIILNFLCVDNYLSHWWWSLLWSIINILKSIRLAIFDNQFFFVLLSREMTLVAFLYWCVLVISLMFQLWSWFSNGKSLWFKLSLIDALFLSYFKLVSIIHDQIIYQI